MVTEARMPFDRDEAALGTHLDRFVMHSVEPKAGVRERLRMTAGA